MAANQVGIDAQVAVVNVREPLVLINPKIVSKENEIPYYEGCLSYPGKGVNTKRYRDIHVQTAQEQSGWLFSGAPQDGDGVGQWEDKDKSKNDVELRTLEAVCVQHEIDHLNGIVCMDRRIDTTIKRTERKIGRNEIVKLIKDDVITERKWKKAKILIDGGWELYED